MRTATRSVPSVAVGLAALALLAACADEPVTSPLAEPAQLSLSGGPASPERQLVTFKGSEAAFAQQVAGIGGEVVFSHHIGVALVDGADEAALESLSSVSTAAPEPEFFVEEPVGLTDAEAATAPASPSDPSTAFFFPRQWNMRAIHADDAWSAGRLGSAGVTVAILDTGIDYLHADLAGRVDLSRSVSFSPADDALAASAFPSRHPITDLHYHGTHVAATVSSNAVAAAGVTSGVTLMGVKVCSVFGGCPGVIQGILYAADNGADVINMSLGFVSPLIKRDFPGVISAYNAIFNYVRQQGVTVVVSAGNSARDLQHLSNGFQGYCDAVHVLCVSATGPTSSTHSTLGPWFNVDAPASYTNYGQSAIDVAAPGGTSPGVVWAACSSSSLVIPICQTGTFIVGLGGTSMSAPHTSGLAALVVEDVGRKPSQVRNRIRGGADVPAGVPSNSPFYGKGRINVINTIGN